MDDFYLQRLDTLRAEGRFRSIPPILCRQGQDVLMDGERMLNFSSNDYLALSTRADLVREFCSACSGSPEFLFSSASARLLSGSSAIYGRLEERLAELFGREACLLFNTGYQCNLGVISALAGRGDVIFADKLVHASAVAGMRLSGASFHRYRHLDYGHLEALLRRHRAEGRQALIITESVFSMDGDTADLDALIALKRRYDALLMVDEAHAFGVFGENLAGMGEGMDIDIVTATCGKSLASSGAFCLGSRAIIDTLVNMAGSFIFSTALPPVNMLWSHFLLTEKFDLLMAQRRRLRALCDALGSPTQILPVLIGDSAQAADVARRLRHAHYFVWPIRPPTVPAGTARLRLSLTADMEAPAVQTLLERIREMLA
ncbi:MAG: aminotransferase class I/II-fold pyridoxal phosphate-dependent enzyme [Desulfovibrionaceae bacterium]